MRILADANIPLIHEFFSSLGEVIAVPPREISREHTEGADMLIVRSVVPINEALVKDTPLRFIGTCTAGTDHFDIPAFERLGIAWTGAPGCNAEAVVQYVFSTLASLEVDWRRARIGIIGCGQVGGLLYARLCALNVACCAYDPFLSTQAIPGLSSLEDVLNCDIICVHAPHTETGPHPSKHLLNLERLKSLTRNAILINAGRGAVVDNQALSQGLGTRKDLRVVLDVWEGEPDISRVLHGLVEFGTPHIAGHSYDGKVRGTEMIYQRACEFLGKPAPLTAAQFDPQPDKQTIRIGATHPDKAINEAILSAYDMRADSERFAKALERASSARTAFDEQRKHYPMRREFNHFQVELLASNPSLAEDLCRLGFSVARK